jgi:hypothetical protein
MVALFAFLRFEAFSFCLSARRVLRRIQNYRGTLDCVFHGESKKNAGEAAFPAARAAVSSRRTKGVLRPRGKRETRFARERRDSKESRLRACFFHQARLDVPGDVWGTGRHVRVSARARAWGKGAKYLFRGHSSVVDITRVVDERDAKKKPGSAAEPGRRGGTGSPFKKEFLLVLVSRPVSAGH